jgi:ribonuclease P protein component
VPDPGDPSRPPRLTAGRATRLTHAREYQAVFAARTSVVRGPLRISAARSTSGRTRLGLSIPRKVGTNVTRNAIKRRLREAFRLARHTLPAGLDVVVHVQPHQTWGVEAYGRALHSALTDLAATWAARASKRGTSA